MVVFKGKYPKPGAQPYQNRYPGQCQRQPQRPDFLMNGDDFKPDGEQPAKKHKPRNGCQSDQKKGWKNVF